MAGSNGWGRRDIRRRCQDLREVLAASPELCRAEDLDAYWPGGRENRLPAPGCWIYCFALYVAFLHRLQDQPSTSHEEIQRAALDAFRDKPVAVELVQQGPDGPVSAMVYPKSYDTISLVDEIDGNVRWLLDQIEQLGQRWGAEDQLHRAEAMREVTELQLTQAWIATHPGVGAPFDPAGPLPRVPDSVRSWDPLDLLTILRGYMEVNRNRNAVICSSLRPAGGGAPVSWATLSVAAAKTLHQPVEHLLRNRSLGAWLAQVTLTWSAERDAQDDAASAPSPRRPQVPEML